ncbi:MAG: VWA domain-containing protein [Spirochaetes bacterium]|nr:VWA domain-containing protein [Spirochaetota bacterium]
MRVNRMCRAALLICMWSIAFMDVSCKKSSGEGRDIILVLDTSRSMIGQGGKNIFSEVKNSLRKFVEDLKRDDTFTMVTFDETVVVRPTVTRGDDNDKEIINSMLSVTKAEGMWTYTMEMLRNVFKIAHEMELQNPARKQIIILLTDGLDDPPPAKRRDRFNIREAAKDYVGKEWYIYLVNFGDIKNNARFKEVQTEIAKTMTKHVTLIEGGTSPQKAVAEVQQTIAQQRESERAISWRSLVSAIVVIAIVLLVCAAIVMVSKRKITGSLEYYNYTLLDPYVNTINLSRFGRKEIVIGRSGADVNIRDFDSRKPFVLKATRVKGKIVPRLVLPQGVGVEFVNREAGELLQDGDMFKITNYCFKYTATS